jgi:hypothetical protein
MKIVEFRSKMSGEMVGAGAGAVLNQPNAQHWCEEKIIRTKKLFRITVIEF